MFVAKLSRVFFPIFFFLKYDVYYRIFRPKLFRAIVDAQDELLGAVGWIDLDF